MNEKPKTLWSGLKKAWIPVCPKDKGKSASSHISLAQGNCLLVLANDLVTRWHALTLAHQVRLKCYLSNQDIYLSQTARRNFFSSPVRMPAIVFTSKKIDRQGSGLEYFTPHWIAKWIISVFNRVSVWKPWGYICTQTAPECSGWGGGGMYNVRVIDWERRSCFGFKELEIQILPHHFHIFFSPPFL